MKINFLGDSITAGAGASSVENNYVSLVSKMLHCEVNNYGVGGTRIAKQKNASLDPMYDQDFFLRALTMDKDADLVFVFGGTNDYGHGDAEMGEIDDNSQYTFCGALNNLINYLIQNYSIEKIFFILPLNRYNQDCIYGEGLKKVACYPLIDYIECEKRIFEIKGIKYLDLRSFFPQPKVNTGDDLTIDGLHPNDKGHRIIADEICKYIKNL